MTAVIDFDDALYQKVISDERLSALLSGRKFYSSKPADGSKLPYIQLGSINEDNASVFNGYGNTGLIRIKIFAEARSKALEIYKHLNRVLNRKVIDLSNNVLLRGELVLNNVMEEPNDLEVTQINCTYSFLTRVFNDEEA